MYCCVGDRTHSLAICQVLLDAKYMENVTETSANFIDGPVLYRFCDVSEIINDTIKENNAASMLRFVYLGILYNSYVFGNE